MEAGEWQLVVESIEDPTCACGRPATQFSRDAIETTQPGDEITTYRVSDLKFGCDEHPTSMIYVDSN